MFVISRFLIWWSYLRGKSQLLQRQSFTTYMTLYLVNNFCACLNATGSYQAGGVSGSTLGEIPFLVLPSKMNFLLAVIRATRSEDSLMVVLFVKNTLEYQWGKRSHTWYTKWTTELCLQKTLFFCYTLATMGVSEEQCNCPLPTHSFGEFSLVHVSSIQLSPGTSVM